MAKESPSNTQHTASAAHQRKPLNPEDAIYIPAPMRPSRAVAQVVARAIARNRCRRRGPAAAKIDTHGAASHGERKNLPDHSRLTGLALDHSLTANTVASFVQQQQAASDLLDTATSSPDKAFAQRNTREGDARFEHTRKLSERDHPIISVVSRKETHVRVNMEGRGLYNEAKNLSEREASNEQRILAPTHVGTTVTSVSTGPPAFQHQRRHSFASSISHHSHTRTPSGLHQSRRLSRTKRVDQGPMPSMADIYPDDAHWSPPALMNERRQNYMSYPAQLAQWPQLNDDNAPKWPSGQPSQQSQFNVDNASNRPSRQFVQQPQFNVGDALKRTSSVQPAKPLESLGVSSGDAFKRSPPTQLAQQSQANVDSAPTWPRVKAYDPNKRRPLPQYEKPLEGLGPSALNPDTAPKRLPYIYDNVFARKKPPVDRKNPAVQPVQQPQVSAGVVLKGPPFEPVTRVEVTVDSILKRPKPAVQSVLRTQVGAGDVLERTPPAEPKKDHEASVAEAAEFWSSGSEPNQRLQALIDYANAPTAQAEANKPKNTLTATDTSRSDAGFHMLMSQMPQPSCTWREMAPVERSLVDDEITGKKWGVRTGGIGDGRLWMAKKDQHGNGPPSLWPRESEPKKNEPKKDDPKKLGH